MITWYVHVLYLVHRKLQYVEYIEAYFQRIFLQIGTKPDKENVPRWNIIRQLHLHITLLSYNRIVWNLLIWAEHIYNKFNHILSRLYVATGAWALHADRLLLKVTSHESFYTQFGRHHKFPHPTVARLSCPPRPLHRHQRCSYHKAATWRHPRTALQSPRAELSDPDRLVW